MDIWKEAPAAEEKEECKNPDKSNCKYCPSKYHDNCKVIANEKAEQEEEIDIWKEAPEGAEYYDNETGVFYRMNGILLQYYCNSTSTWGKSALPLPVINSGLKRNAVIKRPQAEQEEPKEWKDGLPPIDEPCLLNVTKSITYEVVLKWASDKNVVFRHCDDDAEQFAAKDWFKANVRPIKSQSEKEREEFKTAISQAFCDAGSLLSDFDGVSDFAGPLYDWLISSGMAKRLADKADS